MQASSTTPGEVASRAPSAPSASQGAPPSATCTLINAFSVEPSTEAYSGPSPPCGTGMRRALARVEIEEYGLALTVAPSVAVPSGYGLFAELLPGVDEATVPAATPLTPLGGYGDGRLSNSLNEEHPSADRAVAFALSSEASVLHGGIFCQLNGLLAPGQHAGVTSRCGVVRAAARGETSAACTKVWAERAHGARSLAAHKVHREADGEVEVDSGPSPPYFIPAQVAAKDASGRNIGQFANDLAVGADVPSDQDYEAVSEAVNVLALQWHLASAPDGRLEPVTPVSIFLSTTTFRNREPMELGCRYGRRFWAE